jgi:capsular polysaccharide transport system permease protein
MSRYIEHPPLSTVQKSKKLMTVINRHRTLTAVFILSIFASIYWGKIASDRYVSEAHIIIQSTDIASGQTMDFGALLAGAGGGNNTADQMLLRDRLLSIDMLRILDAKLDLRGHYSDKRRDIISRMKAKDLPQEKFYDYFRSRVTIEYDDYAGVLIIRTEAFDPQMAYAITSTLVEEGGHTMNEMARDLARDQVAFIEKQVVQVGKQFQRARLAVIAYQNRKGLVSPQDTATSLVNTIDQLRSQRTALQAQRNVLLGYLTPQAPGIVDLDLQLAAIAQQMKKEEGHLTAPKGNTLNSVVEEFERLQLAAGFAQDVYKTALVALEKSRMEATRTIKKISVLQSATLPQYPIEPRRIYNVVVFTLLALLFAGIVNLLVVIIREHKD